ncbi:hypothetical protein OKW49_001912 [Paraburkholderia youngii]
MDVGDDFIGIEDLLGQPYEDDVYAMLIPKWIRSLN